MTTLDLCPCGSQQTYPICCGPLLEGRVLASTAEALMRSRYTAHALARQQPNTIDYLLATWAPEQRGAIDRNAVADWAMSAEWLGLNVLEHKSNSDHATVEFIAHYRHHNINCRHHELSFFRRDGEHWYFVHGEEPQAAPSQSKLGRNDPCPCGSGKKYKRCCA